MLGRLLPLLLAVHLFPTARCDAWHHSGRSDEHHADCWPCFWLTRWVIAPAAHGWLFCSMVHDWGTPVASDPALTLGLAWLPVLPRRIRPLADLWSWPHIPSRCFRACHWIVQCRQLLLLGRRQQLVHSASLLTPLFAFQIFQLVCNLLGSSQILLGGAVCWSLDKC